MIHPNKSNLRKELEVHLNPEDHCYKHKVNASFVIDVMANLRKVSVTGLSNFQDLVLGLASPCSVYHQYGRCDYVFDMYSECLSPKDCERRGCSELVPIEYSSVEPETPLPKRVETFWPSNNKHNLEKLIYSHFRINVPVTCTYPIVVSQVTGDDETCQCTIVHKGNKTAKTHLHSAFEEADFRIIVHIKDALEAEHNVCVVISNDTDVNTNCSSALPYANVAARTLGTSRSRTHY